MNQKDSSFADERAAALQRLATLHRLRDAAEAGNRTALLESIQNLIAQERAHLRDLDDEPA
jgi:hypothetical protein